jgi:hypothetical protein
LRNAPVSDRVTTNLSIRDAYSYDKDFMMKRSMVAGGTDTTIYDKVCRCKLTEMNCNFCTGQFDTVMSIDKIYDPQVMLNMIKLVRQGLVGYFTFQDY